MARQGCANAFQVASRTSALSELDPASAAHHAVVRVLRNAFADISVIRTRPLPGGIANISHAADVRIGQSLRTVVVRRMTPALRSTNPDAYRHQARLLPILHARQLPVPEPLWVDPAATSSAEPAIVLGWIPGTGTWRCDNPHLWVSRQAVLLASIQRATRTAVGDGAAFGFLPRLEKDPSRLLSSTSPDHAAPPLADDVAAALETGPPEAAEPEVVVHGDFHPGNFLWRARHLVGIVDWDCAARGAPAFDVAHCRVDLAMVFGMEAADSFLHSYERSAGHLRCLEWWDLHRAWPALHQFEIWLPAMQALGRPDLRPDEMRTRLEAFTRKALNRMTRRRRFRSTTTTGPSNEPEVR